MERIANIDDVCDEQPRVQCFAVRLRRDTGESVVGSVGPIRGDLPIRFNGWLEFMAAINTLRARIDSRNSEEPET